MIAITKERMDLLSTVAYPTYEEALEVLKSVQHIEGKTFSIVNVDELNILEFKSGMFGIEVLHRTRSQERANLLPYFYKIISLFLAGDITVNYGFTDELNAMQDEEAIMIDFYNSITMN